MSQNEDEIMCIFSVNASTTNGNSDTRVRICSKVSTRALMTICNGNLDAMFSCYHWREVFAKERIAEALEQISQCNCNPEVSLAMHG